jgi:hypothetical protein
LSRACTRHPLPAASRQDHAHDEIDDAVVELQVDRNLGVGGKKGGQCRRYATQAERHRRCQSDAAARRRRFCPALPPRLPRSRPGCGRRAPPEPGRFRSTRSGAKCGGSGARRRAPRAVAMLWTRSHRKCRARRRRWRRSRFRRPWRRSPGFEDPEGACSSPKMESVSFHSFCFWSTGRGPSAITRFYQALLGPRHHAT